MRRTHPTPRRRRPVLAPWLVVAAALAALSGPPGPAAGSPDEGALHVAQAPRLLALPAPGLRGLPDLSPELAAVSVDSPELRTAAAAYGDADAAHADRRDTRTALDHQLAELDARQRALAVAVAAAEGRARAASQRVEELDGAINELLVGLYVGGGNAQALDAAALSDDPAVNDEERRRVLAGSSLETLVSEREALVDRRDATVAERAELDAELTAVGAALLEAARARPDAASAEVAAGDALSTRRVDYETARVLAGVSGADFPLVALDAYHRAAAAATEEQPACGLRWWGLAGISRVEGGHGTHGGASLDEHGDTSRPIIGIPLDGSGATAAVTDSDGGALDGDPAHDRAVGPMQFIPSTWRSYAADGNGDGVADPHNLYDAALAAGRYLCRASAGLTSDGGLRLAFHAYNHSEEYVDEVLGFARGYEQAVAIPQVGT